MAISAILSCPCVVCILAPQKQFVHCPPSFRLKFGWLTLFVKKAISLPIHFPYSKGSYSAFSSRLKWHETGFVGMYTLLM